MPLGIESWTNQRGKLPQVRHIYTLISWFNYFNESPTKYNLVISWYLLVDRKNLALKVTCWIVWSKNLVNNPYSLLLPLHKDEYTIIVVGLKKILVKYPEIFICQHLKMLSETEQNSAIVRKHNVQQLY